MSESTFQFEEADLDEIQTRATKVMSERKTSFADVDVKLDQALEKMLATKGKEYETRDIRLSTDDVMNDFVTEQKDLASITVDLHEFAKAQGAQLADFENMQHPEALRIIEDAKGAVENSQNQVNSAKVALGTAEAMGFFARILGKKAREVASATKALQIAESRLSSAKSELEQAPAKAAAKHREMLQNASMDESNQRIAMMHNEANNILRENIDSAQEAADRRVSVITATRERLGKATTQSQDAKAAIADLQPEVDALVAQLDSGEIERQTVEYRELEAKISTMNTKLGELKGEMDAAVGEAQELEEKLEALESQRDALLTLKANYERSYRIGVAAAKINSEIATVRLELIQGMADLKTQTELNNVSRDNTLRAHQNAADVIGAVERERVQYMKNHPELMKAFGQINSDLDDLKGLIAEQDEALLQEWNNGPNNNGASNSSNGRDEAAEEFSL